MKEMFRILFVCMGNICRSPAAEGVMQAKVEAAEMSSQIELDSAGVIGFHAGSPADSRMQSAARKRGYSLKSRARQVELRDLRYFDLILAMDRDNLSELIRLRSELGDRVDCAEIALFGRHCLGRNMDVPDPYYGGEAGFEQVLDLLEEGCSKLVEDLAAGS